MPFALELVSCVVKEIVVGIVFWIIAVPLYNKLSELFE